MLALQSDALVLNGVQVMQAAGKSNWAKDQGPMRDLKAANWKLSLSWNLRTESQGRRSKSCWGHLLSGLNLWMAMGKWPESLEEGLKRSLSNQDAPRPLSSLCLARPYLCLPLRHRKPCLQVWSRWEDYTWRLHSSNSVCKVAERLVRARHT